MLPFYLAFLGVPKPPAMLTAFYTLLIAFLMVSRLPVFSGKRVGKRVPPEMVLPVFVVVVLFVALLIAYPWWVLSIGTLFYLGALPLGWMSYQEYQRRDAAASQSPPAVDIGQPMPPQPPQPPQRPPRLN
jgi:CDP-diacylglycerol--serine O-phosphatidyltransferase